MVSSFEETFLGEGCDSAGDRWFAGFVRAVSSKWTCGESITGRGLDLVRFSSSLR